MSYVKHQYKQEWIFLNGEKKVKDVFRSISKSQQHMES